MSFFKNILDNLKKTAEQRAFEERLIREGIELEIESVTKQINQEITVKEIAETFVLQELMMIAEEGSSNSQSFVRESGFTLENYRDNFANSLAKNSVDLNRIDQIFIPFLTKIYGEKLMIESSFKIIDNVMKSWKLGKYETQPSGSFSEEPQEVEELKDREVEEKIEALPQEDFSEIDKLIDVAHNELQEEIDYPPYTPERVNSLMEEYSDIIENIIRGEENEIDAFRVDEFKQHMERGQIEEDVHAIVFCCFFNSKRGLEPTPLAEMSVDSWVFLIQIVDTFSRLGFSKFFVDYLEKEEESVWDMAEENNPYMQYLIGCYYISLDESSSLQAQKIWYEKSANNGFEMAKKRLKNM
jgi:hypothetical protein